MPKDVAEQDDARVRVHEKELYAAVGNDVPAAQTEGVPHVMDAPMGVPPNSPSCHHLARVFSDVVVDVADADDHRLTSASAGPVVVRLWA